MSRLMKNIGGMLVTSIGVVPQSNSGSAINGTGLERAVQPGEQIALSCVLHVQTGATTGTPSTISVAGKLQHSDDNSTWTDYTDPSTNASAAITAITAASTASSVDVDLSQAKRYVRAVVTPAFTGGSSPTIMVSSSIVFGGLRKAPSASRTVTT